VWAGAFALFFSLSLHAQSLQMQVQPSTSSGKDGTATVQLVPQPGKEPLALQWELSFPESIQIDPRASAGEAAAKAGKSIRCEILANRQGKTQTCRCILAGGVQPIEGGAVGVVKYAGARNFRPGRYELELKKAFAVTSDMKKLLLKDTRAQVVLSK